MALMLSLAKSQSGRCLPADTHKPVEYPMAIVKDQDNKATRDYYEYLKTPAASEVFKRYGFEPRTK